MNVKPSDYRGAFSLQGVRVVGANGACKSSLRRGSRVYRV